MVKAKLKIIDDVDLTILLKYGFKYNEEFDFYYWEKKDPLNGPCGIGRRHPALETETFILIEPDIDRQIHICMAINSAGENGETRDVLGMDILFDLIKDGLVEKVEGYKRGKGDN